MLQLDWIIIIVTLDSHICWQVLCPITHSHVYDRLKQEAETLYLLMALQRWFKLSWYVDVKEFVMDHHLEKSL